MKPLRSFAVGFLLAAGLAEAQSPGEIAFWETVRDSRSAAELQAYIDRYPNGAFVVLAKSRLAALGAKPPAAPSPAPAVANVAPPALTKEMRMPQVGDTWTYRLSYPRQWGYPARPSATYVVTVEAVSGGTITDRISVDGTPTSVAHSNQPTLAPQVVSLFSPYLAAMRDLPAKGGLGSVSIQDPPCASPYGCRAGAKVLGTETLTVAGGKFQAKKVLIEETWWPASSGVTNATLGRMNGGRTLTVWYVPELKRAVKFQSRLTVGDVPAVDSNFDLELTSYQVK